jgi:hypothetical protein
MSELTRLFKEPRCDCTEAAGEFEALAGFGALKN